MALNKVKKHKYKQENKMVLKKCWSIKSAPFKIIKIKIAFSLLLCYKD